MSQFSNFSEKPLTIDITSDDPDDYFIEIDLNNCPGAFVIPSSIKAISPSLKIECKWRLTSLVSWSMLRVRYFVISGSGKVVLSANGGFANKRNQYQTTNRRKPASLIFADAKLKWDIIRTEFWFNYIFAKTELFDLIAKGESNYLIKNILSKKKKKKKKKN